jgi:hypothetical protein
MKLSPIVFRLRAAGLTLFGNKVAGAAELGLAQNNTLREEMAFVVQISEEAESNEYDTDVNQVVKETFAVIVALKNDNSQADKTGILAYDALYNVRCEIVKALLGWQMDNDACQTVRSLVEYAGGKVLDVNPAWLWYQFDFSVAIELKAPDNTSDLDELNSIYTQYIMTPSKDIPLVGPDGIPVSTSLTDMNQLIDKSDIPGSGAYARGYGLGFKLYTKD